MSDDERIIARHERAEARFLEVTADIGREKAAQVITVYLMLCDARKELAKLRPPTPAQPGSAASPEARFMTNDPTPFTEPEERHETRPKFDNLEGWDDDHLTEMKKAINQVVWEYAEGTVTLDMAERIACEMQAVLLKLGRGTYATPEAR